METALKNEVANPFGTVAPSHQTGGLVEVESQRAIAEVQAAMVIARKFPRDPIAVMDRILAACTRPSLAESALYSYSRGGSEITGPSIRLAEVLAQTWGNMQFGIRELDQTAGESTVEAYAWDIENNVRQVKVFKVKHLRSTKKGTFKLEDPRDIYELTANQGARRLRACILGVIPGDVIEAAQKQCETTLTTKMAITPELLSRMIEKFAEFGVTKEQVEKRIQRRIDAITPALMVQLGKIANSLKDGMSSPSDWFEPVAPTTPPSGSKTESVKDKLKGDVSDIATSIERKEASTPSPEPPPGYATLPSGSNKTGADTYDPAAFRTALSKKLLDATHLYEEKDRKGMRDHFFRTFKVEKVTDLPEESFAEAEDMVNEMIALAPKKGA